MTGDQLMGDLGRHASPPGAWRRTAGVVATVVTVAAFLLMILAILAAVLVRSGPYGEKVVFGHPTFVVASGSMTPTFGPGDLIIDSPVGLAQAASLKVGQIITFEEPGQGVGQPALVVTHRIVAVGRGAGPGGLTEVQYRTKGDANNVEDALPVAPTAVLGVYQGRVPLVGYLLNALHQPAVFVVLVLIPVIYLVWVETRRRWIAIGRDQRNGAAGSHGQEL